MIDLIQKLEEQLKKTLPGIETQLKMAPESRLMYKKDKPEIKAAVLILIFPNEHNEPSVIFMKRPSYDGHHSGQVSFPGGKFENIDNSLEDTAIRETQEEIGIDKKDIQIIGKLTELYIPVSGFIVHPYVAWSERQLEFKTDKNEVDYLISISIEKILQLPVSETFWDFNNTKIRVPYFNIQNETVWGATSMILNEFIEVLNRSHLSKTDFNY